jgi:hypothetical protein
MDALLNPARVWTRSEVLARPCPVPREAGVYAWYFVSPPPGVPVDGCHVHQGMHLLYVGISPKKPPSNGASPSKQRLWNRVRYHYRGNAYGSTLRLTLGCLLSELLGIELRRVGSGTRLTFATGEAQLSEWMHEHARVAWLPTAVPWDAEHHLISTLSLPLNLAGNAAHPFHATLTELRQRCKRRALGLPIL